MPDVCRNGHNLLEPDAKGWGGRCNLCARARAKRYRGTERGKQTETRRRLSEKYKAYCSSEERKKAHRKDSTTYRNSDKGKSSRYRESKTRLEKRIISKKLRLEELEGCLINAKEITC